MSEFAKENEKVQVPKRILVSYVFCMSVVWPFSDIIYQVSDDSDDEVPDLVDDAGAAEVTEDVSIMISRLVCVRITFLGRFRVKYESM